MPAQIHLLGSFAVISGGTSPGVLPSPRLQSLIAYLAMHPATPLLRSELAYLLWPDSTETQAHTNLRKALHDLRQLLPEGTFLFKADSTSIQLQLRDVRVDVNEFLAALDATQDARRLNRPDLEQEALEKAAALYGGDLLPGCYDEWVLSERERLRCLFSQALGRLTSLLENRQQYRDAIRYAQRLLEYDRWHEDAYQQLMRLYALVGDRAAALHTYHTCVTMLHDELDIGPTAETQEAYARLLQANSNAAAIVNARPHAPTRLVGRGAEWKQLQAAWRVSTGGRAQLVLISGEAGIGKTRLAAEMLDWARRLGISTAGAVCYAAEGRLAFGPVAVWLQSRQFSSLEPHWLSEVARLLPEILQDYPSVQAPRAIAEPWQRQHLFEALAHGLLQNNEPTLCLLDDMQWCDPDSLQWLHFLLRFQPDARLLILATLRPDDIDVDAAANELLTALAASDQLVRLELPRLDLQQTCDLASELAEHQISSEDAAALYRDTEGVPLFIVEMVRAGLSGKEQTGPVSKPGTGPLPGKVRAIILQRLNRLSGGAREVLEVAAVVGREFAADVLMPASGLDEPALVRALDDLWKRRLIREERGVYDFSHDKIRETVYEAIGDARRKWLHRVIAETLHRLNPEQPGPFSGQIAAHYEQAGLNERAVAFYIQAARHAQSLFATTDALNQVQKAIRVNRESRCSPELFELQGDLLAFLQQPTEAGTAYREALIACPQEDWLRRARLHRKYGFVFARVNNQLAKQAIELSENSLQHVHDQSPEYWAEWIELYLSRLDASYWRWDAEEMTALLESLEPVVAEHGSALEKIEYLHGAIRRNHLRNHFVPDDATIGMARQRLELLCATGDLNAIASGEEQLGYLLSFAGLFEEAESRLHDALEKVGRTGDQRIRLISLCYLSLVHRRQTRVADVQADMEALSAALGKCSIIAYEGILRANRAWLAFKSGRLMEAESLGRDAVEIWARDAYPYVVQWPAWTVLFAVAAERREAEEAQACLKALLDPGLVRMSRAVEEVLREAFEAGLSSKVGLLSYYPHIRSAMEEAGYL